MGAGVYMSQHVDDPSKQTEAAAANLGAIAHKAASSVTETTKQIIQHEEGARKASSTPAQGNIEAGVYGDIALESIGGSVGALMKVAKDTLSVVEDRGWFGEGVKDFSTGASFPLTDRINNVSKFFTGKSDADDKEFPPKTEGMEGKQEYQEMTVSRMLHKQKFELSMRLQQEYAAEQAYKQRMGLATGPTYGGPSPGLGMTPRAPSFRSTEIEEPPTNWGAGNVTG